MTDRALVVARLEPPLRWLRRTIGGPGGGAALGLLILLLAVDVAIEPQRWRPEALATTVGLIAPLILVAVASTPPILAGGFDLSIGPLMGLINAVIVQWLVMSWHVSTPLLVVPVALAVGLVLGLFNGFLPTVLRIPPAAATLATYLIYGGLTLVIAPSPAGAAPGWLSSLAGPASALPLVVVALAWWALCRTGYYEQLMATGGNDRAAYAFGVDVAAVRLGAYAIAGLFAGVAGLSLTAVLNSVDPTVGPSYTLGALAAVALGGTSLAGGRGGLAASAIGAIVIFLVQSLVTLMSSSPFTLQISYGLVLILTVCLNAVAATTPATVGGAS